MFPQEESWRNLVFLVIGGVFGVLSLKLWEAEIRERRRTQLNSVCAVKSSKRPQEHDERSC